jgi:hypothetical protein
VQAICQWSSVDFGSVGADPIDSHSLVLTCSLPAATNVPDETPDADGSIHGPPARFVRTSNSSFEVAGAEARHQWASQTSGTTRESA